MSEKQHACPFCGSLSKRSAAAVAENPFCAGCLHERIAAAIGPGPFRVRRIDHGERWQFVREPITTGADR